LDIDNYDQTDEKNKVDESEDVPTANKRSRAMTVIQKKNEKTTKHQLADNLFTVEILDENICFLYKEFIFEKDSKLT
jgi:hypothetical protein